MTPITFKLKRGDALPKFQNYSVRPTWADLSIDIAKDFGISQETVGLAFVNHDKTITTLTSDTDLQRYYDSDKSSQNVKFFVQNRDAPEAETTIISSWSTKSNISKSDEEFLFCWILNTHSDPILVRIDNIKRIDQLKEAIKKKMENTLTGIDHYLLELWKPSSPISIFEIDRLGLEAQVLENIENCIKLRSFDMLQDHFSSPIQNHIHILVQLRRSAKLPTPTVHPSEDTEIRRFRLLCEKYWNRGDRGRAEIYKSETIEVPFMNMRDDGMGTDLEEMAPMNEESDEKSDDMDSDNLQAVSYDSLSLGLEFCDFFDNNYRSILVREEYRDILKHISDLCKNGSNGVVVTGMPGIGKTFFLYFVLIERILNGQRTAFQCDHGRAILILDHHDLQIFPVATRLDPEAYSGMWALVDSNSRVVQPRDEFISAHSKFFVVQAASPQPMRWKTWKKERDADMAVMKPWTWEEMYIGGTKFISPSLKDTTLHDIFEKYGGSARHCFSLARNPAKVVSWEKEIPTLFATTPDISTYLLTYFAEGSSQLITIIPDAIRQPHVTLASRHITTHLFNAVLDRNHSLFWQYYNQFSSVPESTTPAGWLWEIYAIFQLRNHSTPLRRLPQAFITTSSSSEPAKKKIRLEDGYVEPFSDFTVYGDRKSLSEKLSHAICSGKANLFKPGAKNNATYDAFSISDDKVPVVTLYQPTIGQSHSVKAKGLDFLWDVLNGAPGGKKLLPTKKTWRVVFLVDENVGMHWNTAQAIDFGGIKPKHQWDSYIEQFVGVLRRRHDAEVGSSSIPRPISA